MERITAFTRSFYHLLCEYNIIIKSTWNQPDSATRSTRSRPWRLNLVRIVLKVWLGAGMSLLDPLKLAPLESLLPRGTSQFGPPAWWHIVEYISTIYRQFSYTYVKKQQIMLTMTTESLAVIARISAQETVWGHAFSTAALISSMTSNPRTEFLLGLEPFSETMFPLLSSNNDASHPWNVLTAKIQSLISHKATLDWKWLFIKC